VDNDSRGGDDEHAQPNAELATELTGQTRAERRTRFNLRTKTDIPLSALLCATFTTEEAAAAAEAAAAVKVAVAESRSSVPLLLGERLARRALGERLHAADPPLSSCTRQTVHLAALQPSPPPAAASYPPPGHRNT
jgi:hypothetical protein